MRIDEALRVLGLDEVPDIDRLRAAYFDRARVCHPDHGGAPEEFMAVKEAFDRLSAIVIKCRTCGGTGRALMRRGFYAVPIQCPDCKGDNDQC